MRAALFVAISCAFPAAVSAQATSPWTGFPATASESEPTTTPSLRLGKGVTFATDDKSVKLTMRARLQLRGSQFSAEDGEAPEVTEFQARRIRLLLQGHVMDGDVTFYLQLGFSNQDTEADLRLPLRDAYMTFTQLRDANLRFGQMKVPFGKQRVVSSSALQMVDRSQVTGELNLDRDVGVQVMSDDVGGLGGYLGYNVGLFSGDGRNRLASVPGVMLVARGVVRPMGKFEDSDEGDHDRHDSPKVAIGFGGAHNNNTNRERSTFQTPYTFARFDYWHAGADVMFKYRGLSVLSEIMVRKSTTTSVTRMTDTGELEREFARNAWGYYAQGGYLVDRHVEVTARYGELRPRGATDPDLEETTREVGGGLNYYFQEHDLKVQSDYFYLSGEASGRHQIRVQAQLYL